MGEDADSVSELQWFSRCVLQSAAVDWITAVLCEARAVERGRFRSQLWIAEHARAGSRVSAFALGGHFGSQCGGVGWAERTGSAIVQVTSDEAEVRFADVMRLGGRASRLDLQMTYELPFPALGVAARAYRAVPVDRSRGRPTTARTYICSTAGGETCYLGAPSSETRVRVYDKGVESGSHAPGLRWRFEVQARRRFAQSWARQLESAESRPAVIDSIIRAECLKSGVLLPPPLEPLVCIQTDGAQPASIVTTCRWLESSVKPSLARLAHFVPHDEILALLGIDESVIESARRSRIERGNDGSE